MLQRYALQNSAVRVRVVNSAVRVRFSSENFGILKDCWMKLLDSCHVFNYTALSPVFSTNVVCAQSVSKLSKNMLVSNIMIKPNNSIISLKIWYNGMSSILLENTIIPIQVALHHCPHALPQTVITIQLTLLACIIAHMSHHKFFSKAVVLTIAVKALGMLQHTNPFSLNWSWYCETFI